MEDKEHVLHLRVTGKLWRDMQDGAKKIGTQVSSFVRIAIYEKLRRMEEENKKEGE